MRLSVYVPKLAALATIQPGAGIVGGQRVAYPGKLLVDYEDNRASASNIRTYADRLAHAANRHLTGYPTSNRLLADPDDLLQVAASLRASPGQRHVKERSCCSVGTREFGDSAQLEWCTFRRSSCVPGDDRPT